MPTIASSLVNHIRAALWLLDWPQQTYQVEAAGQSLWTTTTTTTEKPIDSSEPRSFVNSTTKLVYGLATDNCAHPAASSSTSLLSTNSSLSSFGGESPNTVQSVLSRDYEIDGRTGFVPSSAAVTSGAAAIARLENDVQDADDDDAVASRKKNRLPAAYDRWEDALVSAPDELALADADDDSARARRFRASGHQWRSQFHQMPVLDTTPLEEDVQLLRRAHHVLAYLVHFYVHSSPPDPLSPYTILVPKALALPLVQVSKRLDIAPVLTFADTVLWNHEIIDTANEARRSTLADEQEQRQQQPQANRTKFRPLTRTNIRPLTLFTRGPDEANFYGCCAEIELRGVEALRAIAHFYDIAGRPKTSPTSSGTQNANLLSTLAEFADELDRRRRDEGMEDEVTLDEAAACLHTVASVIKDLTTILQSVREICDPHAFYFAVRPWFRGSDPTAGVGVSVSSEDEGASPSSPVVPPGMRRWIYEGVDENEVLELSGPSAGQSSIIHTLDIFLDVDHNSTTTTAQSPGASTPKVSRCPVSGVQEKEGQAGAQCPVMVQRQREQEDDVQKQLPNGEFMTRMRKYMPGSHQAFLEQLSVITHGPSSNAGPTTTPPSPSQLTEKDDERKFMSTTKTTLDASLVQLIEQRQPLSIRELARTHPDRLLEPYNDAVRALKQFRDAHIRIACLYVVSMSRKGSGVPTTTSSSGEGMSAEHGVEMMKRAAAGECGAGAGSMGMAMCPAMRKAALAAKKKTERVRGTGGNELSLLLKSCRDATSRTLL